MDVDKDTNPGWIGKFKSPAPSSCSGARLPLPWLTRSLAIPLVHHSCHHVPLSELPRSHSLPPPRVQVDRKREGVLGSGRERGRANLARVRPSIRDPRLHHSRDSTRERIPVRLGEFLLRWLHLSLTLPC